MTFCGDTPDWVKDAIFYQIFPDRFSNGDTTNDPPNVQVWGSSPTLHGFMGGDLQGIIANLDYLLDLGINAIYLNPIFPASSVHRYNTYDYFAIDSRLGDLSIFERFLDLAHRHEIRVILDGVFNHSGRGFFQFHDILENGQNSPYRDWFHIYNPNLPLYAYDETHPPNYACWWGFRSLPKFNTDNPQARRFLLSIPRYWGQFGIDGWRLDVPNEINDDTFWQEFRQVVKTINPQAYIVGEISGDGSRWLKGDQFDGITHYRFRDICMDWIGYRKIDAATFAARITEVLAAYSPQVNLALLNLVGSHDTPRVLTAAGGDTRRARLAFVLLMTYPGAPCIYYGDEIGLSGGNDPDCRGAMIWDKGRWDQDTRNLVKQLVALRKSTFALRSGELRFLLAEPGSSVCAYVRQRRDECIVIVLNAGSEPVKTVVPLNSLLAEGANLTDVLSTGRYEVKDDQVDLGNVAACQGMILRSAP